MYSLFSYIYLPKSQGSLPGGTYLYRKPTNVPAYGLVRATSISSSAPYYIGSVLVLNVDGMEPIIDEGRCFVRDFLLVPRILWGGIEFAK